MARKSYDAERRQLAFRIWREANRNAAEALRRLDAEYGWPLSRATLFGWMADEGWAARADALDADEQRTREQREYGRKGILAALIRQKERYDAYFADLDAEGRMDHQAIGAYTQLLRVIDAYQTKTIDREQPPEAAKPRPGGLTDEVLAEIETKMGLR